MKETLTNIANAPFVQRLRKIESRKMERLQTRHTHLKKQVKETIQSLDRQMKEDFRQYLNDLTELVEETKE